eukprot:TRINITY_DN1957_c0_g1_i1.p1 TRINITY_DN1957_c0_g1~~TRINITY_DN1957_c0_g1_i1.p1  ORF type:complete len:392 (+),score=66.26 TRINITY_DN1957_c0_g1_i1:450-1625(+)
MPVVGSPTAIGAPPVTFAPIAFSPFGFDGGNQQPKPSGDSELVKICKNKASDSIRLSDVSLTLEGIDALASRLKADDCKVTSIHLRNVEMPRECWVNLCDALKTAQHTVTKLDLYGSKLAESELDLVVDVLSANSNIKTVDLSRVHPIGAKPLSRLVNLRNGGVTELRLQGCFIDDASLSDPEFVSGLSGNKTLSLLVLSDNRITHAGFKHLAEALKSNTALTNLDLSTVTIGVEGSMYLAEALRQNASLKQLHMYGAGGKTAGAIAIAEALMSNSSLERLGIPAWFAGDVAGKKFCELLKNNKKIKYLDLRRNDFTDAIAADLAEAIRESHQLDSIEFENNAFTAVGAKLFAEALQVNPHTRVTMYGCPIQPQAKHKISSSVEGNRLSLK